MFEWYLAFMVSSLIAFVSVGLFAVTDAIGSARWWPAGAAIALVAAFFMISHTPRTFLLTRPVQGYIDSVRATRPNLDPNAPENRNIITATSIGTPEIYDPRVRKAKTLEDYARLIKEAEKTGRVFYVNNGSPATLAGTAPALHNLVSDPNAFELVGIFHAIEGMLDRTVYRYRPGSLKGADLSRYRAASAQVHD